MEASRGLDSRKLSRTVAGTTVTSAATRFEASGPTGRVAPLKYRETPTAAAMANHARMQNQSVNVATRRLHGCLVTTRCY
jgi:hypothetical protein